MQKLPLKQLRTDGGTQMRVGPNNQDAIREYAEVLKEGRTLPPVTVFFDGKEYWLADGFHRYGAHIFLNWLEIDAEVREGSRRDAILYAVGANASHGLRRTNADKRRAVEALLKDEEWGKWTDAEIARRACVSAMTVGRVRQDLISNKVIDAPVERLVQRAGTTYTQNTSGIGQRPTAPAPSAAQRLADNMSQNHYEPITRHVQPEPVRPADRLDEPAASTPVDMPEHEDFLPTGNSGEAEPEPAERVIQAEDLYVPFADDDRRKTAAEIEKGVKEIHNALERLLRHERDGRTLLATPDPYTRSVRDLAWHTREMLDEWLDERSEKEARTITVDALN